MEEYKIKYSKKYVNEFLIIGVVLTLGSYVIAKYIVEGGLSVLFWVGILMGLFMLVKISKFALNGRVVARVNSNHIKFHNGRIIPLSDIKCLNRDVTGSGANYKTQLYLQTISGLKVVVSDNKDYEDNLDMIESMIQHFMNNQFETSQYYTDDIMIKYSKSYIYMKVIMYTLIALVIGYVGCQEMFKGKFQGLINIMIIAAAIGLTYFRYLSNEGINITITNNEIITRFGRRIVFDEISYCGIKTLTKGQKSNGRSRTSDRPIRGRNEIINRILYIKTNRNENIKLVESVNTDTTPEEVKNIIALKMDQFANKL